MVATRSRSAAANVQTVAPPTEHGMKKKGEKASKTVDSNKAAVGELADCQSDPYEQKEHGELVLGGAFAQIAAAPSPYESLRLRRIAENQARMASLGMENHAVALTSFFRASKMSPDSHKRRANRSSCMPSAHSLRRSERLKNNSSPNHKAPLSFSEKHRGEDGADRDDDDDDDDEDCGRSKRRLLLPQSYCNYRASEEVERRPGNAPLPRNCPADLPVSPLLTELRCRSKERGTLYDSIVGICCHFCRQKKLCGEEDCQRCSQRDVTKPCLGKSDCSKCHSKTGVFCRACLKIRYGEEMEDVRQNSDWLCAHCSEEQGVDPYWICNSSICLSRRKIPPTGIAIFKAREMGYKSVAHYLADLLKNRSHSKGA